MASHRLSGEGTIRQRADGRWEARLRVGAHRFSRYAADQAGAVAALQELRGRSAAGLLAPATTLTLGAYLSDWLVAHSPALRPSTIESYRQLSAHVQPLAHVRLSRLEPRQIASLYASLRKTGLSAGRVRKLHAVLRKALSDAVAWGLVPRNIVAAVEPPHPEPHRSHLWTLDQVRTFRAVAEADDRPAARLLLFLLWGGLRLGEALALRWEQVDLDAGIITVERSITHVEGRPIEGLPKTNAGIRTIALPPEAVAVLGRQRSAQVARRLVAGADWQGGERIWTTAAGTVPLRQNVRRSLHSLCQRAGIPPIRVHDLRHLHATLLVAGGVDPKTLQRRMGHASLHLSLGVYARALPEADRMAAGALSRLVAATG